MNPIPEIELDGRRKTWRAVALRAIIAIALCLAASKPAAAQQKNETSLTTAQLEELLDKASVLSEKYKTLFKDLTAEEKRVFEAYDKKTDKMEQRRRTESDLIVYASQRDPNQVAEYRNIREVDGKPVRNQIERVEKLFERLGDQELVVIKFEQTEFVKNLFGLRLYEKLNVTGPLMRGQYWLDPQTGQVRRERHEIFFRDNAQPRTFKAIEADYDFTTGEQGIWLPQRILFQYFNPLKSEKGFPVEMFLNVRITSEYGPFRRFEVKARQENVLNNNHQ
jgi:hypothetical protein